MPFFESASGISVSGGFFTNAASVIYYHPTDTTITVDDHDQGPLSDSQVEGNLNEAIPSSPKLPKIIGKLGPVDVTHDETVQPSKADDQPPETEGPPPQTNDRPPDDRPPTKATSPPTDEEQGWTRHVHPEGWIYFFKQHDDESEGIACHEIRGALKGEILTNPTQNTSAAKHEQLPKAKESWPPEGLECGGLAVRAYVDDRRWYASNASNESKDKALLFSAKLSEEEANKLQLNYWTFLHNYPAHHPLPPGAMTAARQALSCHVMEGLVRKAGTRAPFTLAESKALLEHFDMIEKNDNEEDVEQPPPTAQLPLRFPMKTRLVAFVLLNVAKHRQASKYGRNTFREALKAESIDEPSVVFILISSICLFAPLDHRIHIYAAKRSSDLRGDIETWPAYIDALVREWSTFNLAATVLLSASVGFLAVPGIDSVTRIIVLLSVVFTLGSIITGVYLLWRHQGGGGRLEYSMSLLHPGHNVDLLAIILSTPFTFLVWGVVTFLVAAISYSFLGFQSTIQGTNVPIRGRAFISVFVLSIVVLMAMLISFVFFRSFRKRCDGATSV